MSKGGIPKTGIYVTFGPFSWTFMTPFGHLSVSFDDIRPDSMGFSGRHSEWKRAEKSLFPLFS